MATSIGDLVVNLRLQSAAFLKGLDQSRAATRQLSGQMTSAFQSVQRALTGLGAAFGAVGIAQGIRSVVNASLEFESSFAGVRKTVDGTEEELQGISDAFVELSKTIPVSTTELNKIGEAAGQLGIETENIVGFTKVMADLGVTTNLQSDEAAKALARLANITGLPQKNFDRLGASIVELGNNMATTEAEIVEMSLRLAGAGKQIGLTEAQILGFAAALSSVGIEAELGGSAFSRVFIRIAREVESGGDALADFAKVAGQSTEQFSESFRKDAAGAVVDFVEGLGLIGEAGGNVFGTLEKLGIEEIRLRDAVLRAAGAGDLFRRSLSLSSQAFQENNALTEEAAKRYGTAQSQLEIFRNKLTDVSRQIGDSIVPVMLDFLQGLEAGIKTAQALGDSLKIAFGAALVASIATSTAALRAFRNTLAAIQVLGMVRSLNGLRLALLAIVPAAGAAAGALKTLVVPAAVASFGLLTTELYKSIRAQQEAHDTNVEAHKQIAAIANELKTKYNVEIERSGKTWNEYAAAVANAMLEQSGVSEQLRKSAEAAKAKADADAKLKAQQEALARQLEAENEEGKKLVESFKNSLRPADELSQIFGRLTKQGVSAADFMRVYGEEITKAVAAQREFGKPVDETLQKLAEDIELRRQAANAIREQLEVSFELRQVPAILEQLRLEAEKLPKVVNDGAVSLEGLNSAFEALGTIEPLPDVTKGIREVDEAFERLGQKSGFELSGIAAQAQKDFEVISNSGQASARTIAEAFVKSQEAVKAAAEAGAGAWSKEQEKILIQSRKQLDEMDKLKDAGKEVGEAISSGIEQAIQKWEGFGKLAIGILDDIAATILRNSVTAPLTKWLGDAFGALLGGIGGGVAAPAAPTPAVGSFSFAKGGNVAAGMTALVGEAGSKNQPHPELFLQKGFLNTVAKAGDGAALPAFPELDAALSLIPGTPYKGSRQIAEFSRATGFAAKAPQHPNTGMPFLVGTKGPEIFKPPVPGTIVPLDTPQGKKLYESMKRLGLSRESGGGVSVGGSYLTGERGVEIFSPQTTSQTTSGNAVYLTIDARGAEVGVEQKIAQVMRQIVPGLIETTIATQLDRQQRRI